MTERRPHWDDELIESLPIPGHSYLEDEDIYAIIAAVEDWHKAKRDSRIRTHSEGCWRWHNECAEGLIEAQQRKIQQLANELLTVGDIQRVRELHYNTATHHPSGCCSECGGTYPCPTVRALDGGAE